MQENDDNLLITIVDGDENVCIYTLYKFTNGEEKSVYISIIYIYIYVFITGHHLECTQPGCK